MLFDKHIKIIIYFFLIQVGVLGGGKSYYAQCTNLTFTIDINGSQAQGCCNVCGGDYWCYGGACGCCQGPTLSRTFIDPVPAGFVVFSIAATYYVSDCGGTSMATTINGVSIGAATLGPNSCSCGDCVPHGITSTNYGCSGFPSYNYGGSNTIAGTPNGLVCVDRVVLTICYGLGNPIAGTTSAIPTTICDGQSVGLTLTGSSGNIQWQQSTDGGITWANILGANSAAFNTGALSFSTCYRSEVTACSQIVYSNNICITVNPNPIASVNNATICVGQTATLTATISPPGGTYLWSPGGQNTPSITVSPTTTTAYTVTYTIPSGCLATASGTVTVNPLPSVGVPNTAICIGDSTTLLATVSPLGGAYSWSPGGQITPSITVVPTTTSTYTITYVDLNGCINSDSSVVIVNPNPVITIANDSICYGETGVLTANIDIIGGSFLWFPTGETSQTVIVLTTSTVNYSAIYTLPTGCNGMDSAIVFVDTLPSVSVNSPTVCEGQVATLSATVSPPGGSFLWSQGQTTQNISITAFSFTTYSVQYTSPTGCSDTAVSLVSVIPGVNADFTYTNYVCIDNMPVDYINTGTISPGTTYQWWLGTDATPLVSTQESVYNVSYASSGVKYVTLVTTHPTSGCTDTAAYSINIEPLPTLTFFADSPICLGDSMLFTNNSWIGGSGVIAQWLWDFGDSTTSSQFQPYHTYLNSGTYNVELYAASDYGCADSATISVEVSPLTIAGSVITDDTVCAYNNNGTLALTGNTGLPTFWEFSNNGGVNWTAMSNTSTTQNYLNISSTTLFRAFVESGACSGSYSSVATIQADLPTVAGVVINDTSVCLENNVGALYASGYLGQITDWQYSDDDGATWNSMGLFSDTIGFSNLQVDHLYRFTVVNGVCPSDTSVSAKVIVYKFNGAFADQDSTISLGDQISLIAGGGVDYFWYPNYNISDTSGYMVDVFPLVTTAYYVHVYDMNGCVDTAMVTIEVLEDYNLVISNTITPNNDGFNDTWYIGNIENYTDNEVIIINRLGQVVYQKKGYLNDWNGRFNGVSLPDGTYYYILKIFPNDIIFKGSINIIQSQ